MGNWEAPLSRHPRPRPPGAPEGRAARGAQGAARRVARPGRTRVAGGGWGGRPLTDGDEEEDDDEGVDDGDDGGGEGADDVAEGGEAAEDADDAEGADDAQDRDGEVHRAEGREGQADDDQVHQVVVVAHEVAEPVRVHVEEELGREHAGEGHIKAVQRGAGRRNGGVVVDPRVDLRLCRVDDKILPW